MIHLFANYCIGVDKYNYTFGTRKTNKKGEWVITPIAYCGSLADALESARKYFIREKLKADCELDEVVEKIAEVDMRFDDLRRKVGA